MMAAESPSHSGQQGHRADERESLRSATEHVVFARAVASSV